MKKFLSAISKSQMEEYLFQYSSLCALATHLHITRHILVNTIKHLGLPIPRRTFYTCNDNFFSEINEQSMYYAGLLAADGNLYYDSGSYIIKLKLCQDDRAEIEKFKQAISSNHSIYDYEETGVKVSVLKFASKKIFNDLAKFGITPNKTDTLTLPDWLLQHSMFNHFVRGFVDGDGHFGDRRNHIVFHIGGASPAIKQLYDTIKTKCNILNDACFYIETKENHKPFYLFQFRDILEVEKIVNYLYDNATIYIERKKDIALKINEKKQNANKYFFDPIELQKTYNQYNSFVELAKIYKCSPSTIRYQMLKLNLKFAPSSHKHKAKKFNFTIDELEQKLRELKTVKNVATYYECSSSTITTACIEFGLQLISKRNKK